MMACLLRNGLREILVCSGPSPKPCPFLGISGVGNSGGSGHNTSRRLGVGDVWEKIMRFDIRWGQNFEFGIEWR